MTGAGLYDRARHASMWGAVELVARQSIQLLALLGLALLLQPGDFGLMAMVLAFTAFGTLFADFGLGMALVQKREATAADETAVLVVNLAISALLGALLLVVAPLIARFYAEPQVIGLAQLMAFSFPLAALATVPDALLTKRLAFRPRARVELLASTGGAAIAITLALRGYGVWSLAWQVVASGVIRVGALWLISGWRPQLPLDLRGLPGLIRFGGFMLAANLVDTLYTRLQALLIGRLTGARDAGLYTMAQSIPQAPAAFIGALMNRIGLPLMSAIQTDRARCTLAFRRVLDISLFLFAPWMLTLALLAGPLVQWLLGPRWAGTADLLVPLALAALPWPWHVLNLVALNAAGRSDLVLRIELPKKTMAIALLLAASPLGAVGMAWSVALASVLSVPLNAAPLQRLLGAGLRDQLRTTQRTLWLLLAAGLTGLVIRWLAPGTPGQSLSALAAMAMYVGGAVMTSHPAIAELRRMRHSDRPALPAEDA